MRREATARTSSYIAVFQSEGDSSSPVSIQVRNCALSRSSSDLVGVLRFDGGSGTRAFGRDTGAGLAVAGLSGLHMSPTDWCPEGDDVSSGIAWGAARSEERRVGKECVLTCRFRGPPYTFTHKPVP